MAQQHESQHTRRLSAAKADLPGAPGARDAWLVWGVGLNAWLVLCGWPWLFAPRPSGFGAAAAGLSLGALSFGAVTFARHPSPAMRALLLVFPVTLGASVALLPESNREASLGAGPMLLGVLGLWAHGAAALWALARSRPSLRLEHRPLPAARSPTRQEPPKLVGWARALCALLLGAGALGIGVVAPLWGEPHADALRWGEAAREGALLSAVVAGALAAAVAGPFLASVLRPARATRPPRVDLGLRVASLLLLALLGAVTHYVTR